MDERAVRIAARLYEARDAAKALFLDGYPEKVKPYMEIIRQAARNKGLSEMAMGQQMARDLVDSGRDPSMVLAAIVELVEPSPEVARA